MSIQITVGTDGISKAIANLENKKKHLKELSDKVALKLAEEGSIEAEERFASASYAGGSKDDIEIDINKIDGGYEIYASGEQVLFIEYGVGIEQTEHSQNDFPHGSLSKTYSARQLGWWDYPKERGIGSGDYAEESGRDPDKYHTHGFPAQECMYRTEKSLRDRVQEIVSEVLRND